MRKIKQKVFPSKLLLFGEHLINIGGKGLAVPVSGYNGQFSFSENKDAFEKESNESLQNIASFLVHSAELEAKYNCSLFLEDCERGLYFDSNIPQGFGLGSSGALVAAIASKYRCKSLATEAFTNIKNELAQIESLFHGKSSGVDPLVCFLNKVVLLENKEVASVSDFQSFPQKGIKVFLINTQIARKTAPLVDFFLKKYSDPNFKKLIDSALIPANDTCINSFFKNQYAPFLKGAKIISQIQLDHFKEFIPASFQTCWKDGILNDQYYLKICGAGGGGFILGFCKSDCPISSILSSYKVIEIFEF